MVSKAFIRVHDTTDLQPSETPEIWQLQPVPSLLQDNTRENVSAISHPDHKLCECEEVKYSTASLGEGKT